jgi:hypothetical protein
MIGKMYLHGHGRTGLIEKGADVSAHTQFDHTKRQLPIRDNTFLRC